MRYQLVAIDLDGTLLRTDHTISPYNQKVIRELIARGVHILIATGRTFTAAKQYHNLLGLESPMINCNGGFVYDPVAKDALFGYPISKRERMRIAELFEEAEAFYMFYTDNTIYAKDHRYLIEKWDEENQRLDEENKINIVVSQDLASILKELDEPIYKFLGIEENESKWRVLYDTLKKEKELEVVSSFKAAIDIMEKGITKGKALQSVADYLKIPMEAVIALGDNDNDATMLEAAGLGIAMENATDAAKASADDITHHHEDDGVGRTLNDLFHLNIERHPE